VRAWTGWLWMLALLMVGGCPARDSAESSTDIAAALSNRILLSERRPPLHLAEGAEVLVVSGHEAEKTGEPHRVRVSVERPGRRVLLVLAARTRIAWEVVPASGTQVVGVLVSHGQGSTVQMAEPASGFTLELPVPQEPGGSELRALLARLHELFDITRIDLLRAQRTLPRSLALGPLDPPRPELAHQPPPGQAADRDATFTLISSDLQPVKWRFDGPLGDAKVRYWTEGKVALAPDGRTAYRLAGDQLVIKDLRSGVERMPALPAGFPRFSWAMDVAYDSKRNYVTVVTLGGEGHLYRFDAVNGNWVDVRSVNQVDIGSIAYEPRGDRYLAWTTDNALMVMTGDGSPTRNFDITSDLRGFSRATGDRRSGFARAVTLAGAGEEIAIIAFDHGRQSVKAVWRYHLATGVASRTY